MPPTSTIVVLLFALVVLYLVARWVRARTTTEEDEQKEQVRYLIRSGTVGGGEKFGARSGLLVSRYYFRNTDVETGPTDVSDFYDELFIHLRDADSPQTWENTIHVATPRGLDRMMAEEHWDSVIGGELLIVRKYDLQKILNGAIDHLQEIYEVRVQIMGRDTEPPEMA